jgi:hypothetical protein
MKPGLSSPASITEISTAAIVWLTSSGIVTNFITHCLTFFDQLDVHTWLEAVLAFLHGSDQAEYSLLDRITDTAVYHDVRCTQYTNQG